MDYIEMEKEVKNTIALVNKLLDDMDVARKIIDKEIEDIRRSPLPQDDRSVELRLQPLMRIMTHCVFAAIDGFCYKNKNIALQLCDLKNIQVSKQERQDILEKIITKSGKSISHYLRTEDNILLTFTVLYRAFGLNYEIIDCVKWEKLRVAIAIRNRITHPKSLADIEITGADYRDMSEGYEWFAQSWKRILIMLKEQDKQR